MRNDVISLKRLRLKRWTTPPRRRLWLGAVVVGCLSVGLSGCGSSVGVSSATTTSTVSLHHTYPVGLAPVVVLHGSGVAVHVFTTDGKEMRVISHLPPGARVIVSHRHAWRIQVSWPHHHSSSFPADLFLSLPYHTSFTGDLAGGLMSVTGRIEALTLKDTGGAITATSLTVDSSVSVNDQGGPIRLAFAQSPPLVTIHSNGGSVSLQGTWPLKTLITAVGGPVVLRNRPACRTSITVAALGGSVNTQPGISGSSVSGVFTGSASFKNTRRGPCHASLVIHSSGGSVTLE